MKTYTTPRLMQPQNEVTAECSYKKNKYRRNIYFWHLQEHAKAQKLKKKKRGVYYVTVSTKFSWEAMCSQLKLLCHFPSAVCQQKERTSGTRSPSAESWQSCWTIRRACLTRRTMTSPPPTTTAPSMSRSDPSLLHHTSSSSRCACV